MRTRVPRTRTFELYRKGEQEAPELLEQIYAVISHEVEAGATETIHRSTVLIERVPSDWPFRDQWLRFLDSESARRSLFEQRCSGPYFFDREEMWETTWPDKDRTDAEYTRAAPMPSVAQAPGLGRASATVAPETSSRGITPEIVYTIGREPWHCPGRPSAGPNTTPRRYRGNCQSPLCRQDRCSRRPD